MRSSAPLRHAGLATPEGRDVKSVGILLSAGSPLRNAARNPPDGGRRLRARLPAPWRFVVSTAALTIALVGASALFVWLAFCIYVIERHPADAERYIRLSGRHFPLSWHRKDDEDPPP